MSEYIEVGQPLQFTDPNTPTRVGEIVENVSDIYNIPSPRLGMQVFVKSEKKSFVITSLKSKVIGGVNVPEAAVEAFEPVGAKSITWNNDSNMNDFVVAGVYDIKGERTRIDDNLPILNTGGGHSFNARLTVLDSSISGSGKDDDKCITQVLSFSNRLGQGEVYIRTGKGSSLDNLTWEKWSTLQRNVNVGEVTSLDHLIDNGIYSGIWREGSFAYVSYPFTFVCVVINDYFLGGSSPRKVSQFVYGVSALDGTTQFKYRVKIGNDNWSDWEILNKNEINSMITDAVDAATKAFNSRIDNLIDGAPETLDTLKEIADWVNTHEDLYQFLESIVELNTQAIEDEKTRAENAEKDIKRKAVDVETLNASELQDKVNVYFRNLNGAQNGFTIPAATAEKAGVMSAKDKVSLDSIPNEIDKLKDGDTIVAQAREIHSRNGKTVPDSFLVRTTAGSGTIGDGVASLKSVGGNIVKNLVDGTFASGWTAGKSTVVINNGIIACTTSEAYGRYTFTINLISGHKFYVSTLVNGFGKLVQAVISSTYNVNAETRNNGWTRISYITDTNLSSSFYIACSTSGHTFYATKPLLIDLTEKYGAGKEPDKATCDKLFGTMDALPQGLTVAKPNTFTSTGFNQFNPDNVLEGKAIANNAIVSGDKKIAVIPCLPCKVGTGENNGYCIHGEFGDDIKVYLTPLNPMEVDGELYMHELTKDATTDTYVPLIKGYMLVEVPTTANLCAHFLWSEDKCERDSYEPYHESKVGLPVIPQISELGLAGIQTSGTLACDEIDFERGVYVKRIGGVDLGVLSWDVLEIGYGGFIARKQINAINNCLCHKYSFSTATAIANQDNKTIRITTSNGIIVKDTEYSSAASLKESLQGVMLYYELATPEEYPLPKVDNSYISSDYGVEQFDSVVPCNANNLYYMRSLAGETRNFLDRMYNNTAKSDAKEVADYITNNIANKIPLATAENNGLMSAAAFSSIGEVIDITEEDEISFYVGSNTNKTVFNYYTKSDNCTITATLKNVVGNYYSVRFYLPSTYNLPYVIMEKCSNGNYFGSKSLIGLPKGSLIQIKVFTNSTNVGSVNENSVIEIKEQSYKGNVRPRVDIFTSDTQLEVFEKMLYANNIGHCDVHFQMGTYIFDETLYDWMRSERKYSRAELPIGGNCRYFFNGATLIGSYAGEDTHVAGNCNVLGCALTSGNFELHDGTIIANDIIYGVHDDGGLNAMGDSHLHKYSNMHIIYNGGTHTKDTEICKCIGGGTCKNLTVVIDNCVLEKYTENVNKDCVTYHGFSNNPSYQTKARIVITNTWMTGACRAYHLVQESRNETIEFVVSNCRTNIPTSDVDKLITWNNEPIS